MSNPASTSGTAFVRRRHRERLSAAISAQRNAGTSGVRSVYQRCDGSILRADTSWWSYDIGEALDVAEALEAGDTHAWHPLRAHIVPVEVARSFIIKLMEADLLTLSELLVNPECPECP